MLTTFGPCVLVVSPRHPFIMFDNCVAGITDRRLMDDRIMKDERGLDRSDRQVFEREVGVKDDCVAAAR